MAVANRKTHVRTTRKMAGKLTVYCMNNKEALEGKTLSEIFSAAKNHFPDEPFNVSALVESLEVVGISYKRLRQGKGKSKNYLNTRKMIRIVRDVFVRLEEKIADKPGDFITPEELSQIHEYLKGSPVQ